MKNAHFILNTSLSINPWMRKFGYCDLYDRSAALIGVFIKHKKISFCYGGREWMFWLWKGQYGGIIGAEIGIYIHTPSLKKHSTGHKLYRCARDNELQTMALALYNGGDEVFTVGRHLHWWVAGAVKGSVSDFRTLHIVPEITFADPEMARLFCESARLRWHGGKTVKFYW